MGLQNLIETVGDGVGFHGQEKQFWAGGNSVVVSAGDIPTEETPLLGGMRSVTSANELEDLQRIEAGVTSAGRQKISIAGTCFGIVNVYVGLGLLSQPYAIAKGGWVTGIVMLFFCILSKYTGILIVKCFERLDFTKYEDRGGKTFSNLARILFGMPGAIMVFSVSVLELFGVICVCQVILWQCMLDILPFLPKNLVCIACSLSIIPCLLVPNFSGLKIVSVLGTMASLVVSCTCAVVYLTSHDKWLDGYRKDDGHAFVEWQTLPMSVGIMMLSFAAHATLPSIHRAMRQSSAKETMVALTERLNSLPDDDASSEGSVRSRGNSLNTDGGSRGPTPPPVHPLPGYPALACSLPSMASLAGTSSSSEGDLASPTSDPPRTPFSNSNPTLVMEPATPSPDHQPRHTYHAMGAEEVERSVKGILVTDRGLKNNEPLSAVPGRMSKEKDRMKRSVSLEVFDVEDKEGSRKEKRMPKTPRRKRQRSLLRKLFNATKLSAVTPTVGQGDTWNTILNISFTCMFLLYTFLGFTGYYVFGRGCNVVITADLTASAYYPWQVMFAKVAQMFVCLKAFSTAVPLTVVVVEYGEWCSKRISDGGNFVIGLRVLTAVLSALMAYFFQEYLEYMEALVGGLCAVCTTLLFPLMFYYKSHRSIMGKGELLKLRLLLLFTVFCMVVITSCSIQDLQRKLKQNAEAEEGAQQAFAHL